MDYLETAELLKTRRSVRRYTDETVKEEDIERMIEAFRWAPSAHNRQPWFLVASRNRKLNSRASEAIRREVAEIIERHPALRGIGEKLVGYSTFFDSAPLVFYVCGEPQRSGWRDELRKVEPDHPGAQRNDSWLVSTAAALQNLLLSVHALGYGACWLGAPLVARKRLEQLLELPEGRRLLAVVPVGRPAEEPHAPLRRPEAETVRRIN